LHPFFVSRAQGAYYLNTFEMAELLSLSMPGVIQETTGKLLINARELNGNSQLAVADGEAIRFQNSALFSSVVLVGQQQKPWQVAPIPTFFSIRSGLIVDGEEVYSMGLNDEGYIEVEVQVERNLDHAMVEVPIPAGFITGTISAPRGSSYNQRDGRVSFFFEGMSKGQYVLRVPIKAKFAGVFTIMPARVSLMYFENIGLSSHLRQVSISR